MAKYLIINADDFGLNKEQNEAIKDLLNNKLITSTSLAVPKTVSILKQRPRNPCKIRGSGL